MSHREREKGIARSSPHAVVIIDLGHTRAMAQRKWARAVPTQTPFPSSVHAFILRLPVRCTIAAAAGLLAAATRGANGYLGQPSRCVHQQTIVTLSVFCVGDGPRASVMRDVASAADTAAIVRVNGGVSAPTCSKFDRTSQRRLWGCSRLDGDGGRYAVHQGHGPLIVGVMLGLTEVETRCALARLTSFCLFGRAVICFAWFQSRNKI